MTTCAGLGLWSQRLVTGVSAGFFILVCLWSPVGGQGRVAAEHHLHIRTEAGAAVLRSLNGADGPGAPEASTAADALAALDAASVPRALVLSVAYMFGSPAVNVENEYAKVRAENDYVAEQVATVPDRLVGACSVNPLAQYATAEIERCARDARLVAVKFHFANSGVDLRQEAHLGQIIRVFRLAHTLNLPIVVHFRASEREYENEARIFVEQVLSEVPGLPVQIAHMAGWGGYDAATDAALGVLAEAMSDGRLDGNRITFDLGAVVFNPEAAGADTALARTVRESNLKLANRIRQVGVERVVYATDWPSWPPVRDVRTGIGRNIRLLERALPLTPAELEAIFGNSNEIVNGWRGSR